MKALWSAVSFFAVVNLLVIVFFVGWLWRTDRLNMDRVQKVRELFAPSIAEEARLAEEAAAEAKRDAPPEIVPARLSSAERLDAMTALHDQERQVSQRLREEGQMLSRQFELLTRQTQAEREAFEAERQSWEDATRAERERKADEQFAQTVQQYESIPARQGKEMLVELIGQGRREQAVAYLDAMKPRAASKILREFKSPQEVVLATELLEELRTFGLGTVDAEPASDDTADDTAGKPAS